MNPGRSASRLAYNDPSWLDTLAAWLLALLWVLPLVYAVCTRLSRAAVHWLRCSSSRA